MKKAAWQFAVPNPAGATWSPGPAANGVSPPIPLQEFHRETNVSGQGDPAEDQAFGIALKAWAIQG
jgi:hypothetical protein